MKEYTFRYDDHPTKVCEHIEEAARVIKKLGLEFGDCDGDDVTISCWKDKCSFIKLEDLMEILDKPELEVD